VVTDTAPVVVVMLASGTRPEIEDIVNGGIQVLAHPDAGTRIGSSPGWSGGAYTRGRCGLATRPQLCRSGTCAASDGFQGLACPRS
jgi:hypothetical protein